MKTNKKVISETRLSQLTGQHEAFLTWRWSYWRPVSKVELGLVATDILGDVSINSCSFFGCAEPNADALVRVSNFSCPFLPWPLPYSSVHVLANSLCLLLLPLIRSISFLLSRKMKSKKKVNIRIVSFKFVGSVKLDVND